jgi:hypothetical protein
VVNIGQGSLFGISSGTAIYLMNFSGQTVVNVDASRDGAQHASIYSNMVTVEGVNIHYETNDAVNGISRTPINGIMAIDINLANGSSVDAESVGTSITVDIGLYDPVYGPAANLLKVRRRSEAPPGPIGSGPGLGGGNPTTGKNL